nr:molybdopterin-dependent oxidoreductase [Hyphomicrobium facile]
MAQKPTTPTGPKSAKENVLGRRDDTHLGSDSRSRYRRGVFWTAKDDSGPLTTKESPIRPPAPVSVLHGAPLRLRCENELGFKMVKWIAAIEFVNGFADLGAGQGGYNEDHEFYGYRMPI